MPAVGLTIDNINISSNGQTLSKSLNLTLNKSHLSYGIAVVSFLKETYFCSETLHFGDREEFSCITFNKLVRKFTKGSIQSINNNNIITVHIL